ncbi:MULTISPECIES: helix-turn-helix transcriptional regulator [unclassified Flavobacterium]|uniref:helix-turn-helix transcriptional regulator n=1 Tax=unclassified Flavobacterium TaxID=196869 RepID=UPI0018E8072B|nr:MULTISPECIES: helix-turn-helix transcriptional regulator [unclassified Flavobacterium]MBJ2124422.1 helix-turn-helix transcriptional regulator [Flavobacterium sp. IB48]
MAKKTKLQEIRLKRQINQDVMAVLVNMKQGTYSRKERGLTSISDSEWERIALVLGVNKEDIYQNDKRASLSSGKTGVSNTFTPVEMLKKIDSLEKENKKLKAEIKTLKKLIKQ